MKKCCLNCAFCIRHQDKTLWNGTHIYNDDTEALLTPKEREQAFKKDFSFLGVKIREQKAWEAKYNQTLDNMKKGAYNQQLGGGPRVLDLLMMSDMHPNEYSLASTFGMTSHPDAPDSDYLACWHKLWNFKDTKDKLPTLCKKNKCLFFYPYDRKGNKSFEGCEKEREALLAKSRFTATNWLVILGIIVTILIFAIQKWDNRQIDPQPEVKVEPKVVQKTLPQPPQITKNPQKSESEKK